jgi:hypothetical protein
MERAMSQAAITDRSPVSPPYKRHRPEQTLLYQIIERYYPEFKESGFSLHAGVAAQAWERPKLERLCRYITRPAVSEKRLSLTLSGNIRYDVNAINKCRVRMDAQVRPS